MNVLHHARRSRFIMHNAVFFGGSVLVGALNYLYYPVMGRLLSPAAFGDAQALISLALQATVFLSVLGLVTINIVTNYRDEAHRNAVILEFEKLALIISVLALLASVFGRHWLQSFLQLQTQLPVILLMVALVFTVPFTFRGAFLRGKEKFGQASVVNIVAAGGKLLCAIVLVLLGFQTAGAIGGFAIAQLIAAALAAWWALGQGLSRTAGEPRWQLPKPSLLAPELSYGLLVLAGSLVVTMLYSVDIIFVKHYFNPHLAGLYAGVASVARILFFLTASIALVLMPMIKLGASRAENLAVLRKSCILLLGIGLPVVALFSLAPTFVLHILMGRTYDSMAYILPPLSITIFLISILNLFVSYFLALRQFAIAPVTIIGGAATLGLMFLHHATPLAIVANMLIGGVVVLLGIVCMWFGGATRKQLA